MELSSRITFSLDLLNSATKWRTLFECLWLFLVFYVSLQPRKRVYNSSSHINIYITSVANEVDVVADVNICTTVCLPLIRIRMRNYNAWTPVFNKNESKDRKRETKKRYITQ